MIEKIGRNENHENHENHDFESLAQMSGKFDPEKARRTVYDERERIRVEKFKDELRNSDFWNISEMEKKQIDALPSNFTKRLRLVFDKMGIRTKKSEEKRDREAMHIALSEYREEEEEKRRVYAQKQEEEAFQREKKQKEYEEFLQKKEEEEFFNDMGKVWDTFLTNKQERFRKQRTQEIVERELNERLLNIENLETEVMMENPEVSKRSLQYQDGEVVVYDLSGMPFSILSTTVDYRRENKPGDIGTETYKEIMSNPGIWAESREEAERAEGFGTRESNARGDTISASYWNSERNIKSHVSGELVYGFSRVKADSIIAVQNGDGGTSNMAGKSETFVNNPDSIKQLEEASGSSFYNEVLLRRYDEDGKPKKPDYIICENGEISEAALLHAKYFNIPIVNIDEKVYQRKAEERGEEIINSISEKDSYQEIDKKISEVVSMSRYKGVLRTFESIGRKFDVQQKNDFSPLSAKCFEISKMEQLKRLDFIRDELMKATAQIESGNTENALEKFEFFNATITDVFNQTRSTMYRDERDSRFSAPGNCNVINISFRLKNSSRLVHTNVYDGQRIYKQDEAITNGIKTEEDIKESDSSYYDTLLPVVENYIKIMREKIYHRTNN